MVRTPDVVEPEVDALERPQRPQHQARADEQDDGQGHFGDDEAVPESGAAAAGRRVAPAFFHRVRQVRAQQTRRGGDAENHRGGQGDADREQQHAPVDGCAGDAGNARRVPPREQAHADPGERKPGGGADAGEHEAFGEQLPHEIPRGSGASRPHGHLALARLRPREQQVGDVRAGDEQEEADRAEQQPDRAADRADDLLAQRQHDGVELHLRRVEAVARPALRDCVQVVADLRDGRARREPAGRVIPVAAVVRTRAVPPVRGPQHAGRWLEVCRRYQSAGMMPTTSCGAPLIWIVRPTIEGSPP